MVVIVNTFDSIRQSAVSKTQKPVPAFCKVDSGLLQQITTDEQQ